MGCSYPACPVDSQIKPGECPVDSQRKPGPKRDGRERAKGFNWARS